MNPVRTTSIPLVIGLVFLGGAIGWSGVAIIEATGGTAPRAPWSAAAGLAFFAALLFAGAWYMYDRLQRKQRSVEPLLAVRLLVLAKASALVGALVGGAYVGFALHFVAEYGTSSGRDRVVLGLLAAGAGLLVAVGGLLLERACKVPKGPDDPAADGSPATDSNHRH